MTGTRAYILPFFLCLLALSAGSALAQPGSDTAETGTENPEQLASQIDGGQLQSLIDTLEDPERRAIFLERLNTLRALQQEERPETSDATTVSGLSERLIETASGAIDGLTSRLQGALAYINTAPNALNRAWATVLDPEQRLVVGEMIAIVVGTLLTALAGAWIVRWLLERPWQRIRERASNHVLNKALLLMIALVLRLVPLAVFLGLAYLILPVLDPEPLTRTALLFLVYAHLIAQTIMTTARTALAVHNPELRPYRLQDETAAYVYVWVRRVTIISVYGYFINQALLLLGMDGELQHLLVDLTGLIVALLFVAIILQSRAPVAQAIQGDQEGHGMAGQLRGTLARFWHLLAFLYVIGIYVVWVTELEGGFAFMISRTVATLVVIMVARLALTGAEHGMKKVFHMPDRLREEYPDLEQRADRYRPALTQALKVVLMSIAAIAVAQIWGLNATAVFASEAGQVWLARLVRILLIVAAGFLVWEIIAAMIERKLHASSGNSRRLITVLPLLKNVARITIGAVAIMIVLSELGMNIGPLIASAGVIGLAVGFGAQTLVRDLISGLFVIFEDIIAVGDWVEIGPHTGIVQAMHIRTMELRDVSGNIRVIPFGDVTSVHKVASDYSYAMIFIGVAYREDVDEVTPLLSQICEEMQEDENWKDIILEPLMVDGVNEMAASSIEIRVRIKCKPLEQWGLRREFLRRTKKLFDEQGIEIPFPHQTLYFGQDKDGSAPAAHIRLQEMAQRDNKEEKGTEQPGGDQKPTERREDASPDNSSV